MDYKIETFKIIAVMRERGYAVSKCRQHITLRKFPEPPPINSTWEIGHRGDLKSFYMVRKVTRID